MLTHIFNSMLRLTHFLTLWKFSIIVMIPKSRKSSDYLTYTETSYTNNWIQYPKLSIRLPHKLQCYSPNPSSSWQNIILTKNKINMNKCISRYGSGFWQSVALDLLFKLKTIFPPYYYLLFKSYLEHRFLAVCSESAISEINSIHAGVAPLLFNLYNSEQPTTNSTITGDFADNKAILSLTQDLK